MNRFERIVGAMTVTGCLALTQIKECLAVINPYYYAIWEDEYCDHLYDTYNDNNRSFPIIYNKLKKGEISSVNVPVQVLYEYDVDSYVGKMKYFTKKYTYNLVNTLIDNQPEATGTALYVSPWWINKCVYKDVVVYETSDPEYSRYTIDPYVSLSKAPNDVFSNKLLVRKGNTSLYYSKMYCPYNYQPVIATKNYDFMYDKIYIKTRN